MSSRTKKPAARKPSAKKATPVVKKARAKKAARRSPSRKPHLVRLLRLDPERNELDECVLTALGPRLTKRTGPLGRDPAETVSEHRTAQDAKKALEVHSNELQGLG